MRDAKKRRNTAQGSSKKMIISVGLALCLLVGVVMLYPAMREYYIAYRTNEQLLQELIAVEERNDYIRTQIAYLNTKEGISDRARERFGWAPPGEQTVNITGLEVSDSTTLLPEVVPVGSGEAPDTWWILFLDILFAIEKKSLPDLLPDPFVS